MLGGWPVINPNWENETTGWVLEKVIGSLRGVYNIALLIDLWVAADDKNSSINVITVSSSFFFTMASILGDSYVEKY